MLKQLMHSMSMALIRDKAVKSFLERIQGSRPISEAAGWLELRKGYQTYLTVNGTLVIYRAEVLHDAANAARANTGKNGSILQSLLSKENEVFQLLAGSDGPWGVDRVSSERQFVVDRWHIHVKLLPPASISEYEDLIKTSAVLAMSDLLPGSFKYHLLLPVKENHDIELVLFRDHSSRLEVLRSRFSKRNTASRYWPQALMKMDMRLKTGLPILVPKELERIATVDDPSSKQVILELTFQYVDVEPSI